MLDQTLAPTVETDEKVYYTGGAIKALGDGEIEGYLVVWGSPAVKDSYGEWFTPQTNYELQRYESWPILYHHELDKEIGGVEIGRVYSITPDNIGLLAKGKLDLSKPHAPRIYSDVLRNRLYFSSGTVPHWVDAKQSGEIIRWPIAEASLTPSPAEKSGRTSVHAIRSAMIALEQETSDVPKEPQAEEVNSTETDNRALIETIESFDTNYHRGEYIMSKAIKMDSAMLITALENAGLDAAQTVAVMKEFGAAESGEMEQETPEPTDAQAAPAVEAKAAPEKVTQFFDAKGFAKELQTVFQQAAKVAPAEDTLPGVSATPAAKARTPQISIRSQYEDLSAQDMAYYAFLMNKSGRKDRLSVDFYREASGKAIKAYEAGEVKFDTKDEERRFAAKTSELNTTLVADDGADWVPTLWTSDLWARTRIDNKIASAIQSFAMPSASYEYPIESTDPTVYAVAESDDAAHLSLVSGSTFTSSKVVTDKVTFTAKKLGLQTMFSVELDEDSIVQFIPQLRNQALRAMQNAIDNVIANADATTGTGNINLSGANTSTVPTAKFLYGGGNGFRYNALISVGAAAMTDAGGAAPTLSLIRSTIAKLSATYSVRPSEIKLFVDVATWHKLKSIDELLVYMNNGRGSTVNDGIVPMIDGSEVVVSEEVGKTLSTGYYSSTAASNTLGQLIVVHTPGWKLGYRRQVTTDVSYLPYYDSYVLTMTARMALGKRDTGTSALLYNIGVS